MNFPSELDFLEEFGIEPVDVDHSTAYCRYRKKSDDGLLALDFSFSAVSKSFQVVLSCAGNEIATVSAEDVRNIEIRRNQKGHGVHVVFGKDEGISEAEVTLEPALHCLWWSLKR